MTTLRRRAQNQTLRHRGREGGPLYRSRKLLLCAHETVNAAAETKLLSLLEAGDPRGEARDAWHAVEALRGIYDISDPELGKITVDQLADEFCDPCLPKEVNRLRRTLARWRTQISNWHRARVANAATETADNPIKRVKRAAFE